MKRNIARAPHRRIKGQKTLTRSSYAAQVNKKVFKFLENNFIEDICLMCHLLVNYVVNYVLAVANIGH